MAARQPAARQRPGGPNDRSDGAQTDGRQIAATVTVGDIATVDPQLEARLEGS